MPKTLEEFIEILQTRCNLSAAVIESFAADELKRLHNHFNYYVEAYSEEIAVKFFMARSIKETT